MKTIILILFLGSVCFAQSQRYLWLGGKYDVSQTIKGIPCLSGYERIRADSNSFADWLRNLPLKKTSEKVRLFDNQLKLNQNTHYRIIDIDRGKKDLQQCADAIIRLRAEYLYQQKLFQQIHFNFSNGATAQFTDWIKGLKPRVDKNEVEWVNSGIPGNNYTNFRKYLETVFMYAGSYSLKNELLQIANIQNIKIGDIFIQGGFPGHAIIVVDLCTNKKSEQIAILLAQSYMPAQDIHIIKNLNNTKTSPWYIVNEKEILDTPEWNFEWSDIYSFE